MNKVTERVQNLTGIFQTLRIEGAMTQADLKERHALQASTISYLVQDLRKINLIRNSSQPLQTGRVGKPGQLLELDNSSALFLGLYIEETFVDFHLIGIADKEIHAERIPLQATEGELADKIIEMTSTYRRCYPAIKGIGIAVKSVVEPDGNLSSFKRRNHSGGYNNWKVEGFTRRVTEAFSDITVVVENDANCGAVYCHAAQKNRYRTVLAFVLNLDPFGIGCGMIINDTLFRGSSGSAGEFYFPDTSVQDLIESLSHDNASERFIGVLKESLIKQIYFIDPEITFLTGDLFESMGDEVKKNISDAFSKIPYTVQILSERRFSLPAKGAVLLASDEYISKVLQSMSRR